MTYLRQIIFFVIVFISVSCLAQSVTPQIGTAEIQAGDVQAKIDTLPSRNLSEIEVTAAKNSLQQALLFIEQRDTYQAKLVKLTADIKESPERVKKYRKQLEALLSAEKANAAKQAESMNDNELTLYNSEQNTQLNTWKAELAEVNKTLLQMQTRPQEIQTTLGTLEQNLHSLSAQTDNSTVTVEELLNIEAQQQAITAQAALLRQELHNNALLEAANLQKKILELQIGQQETYVAALEKIMERRRLAATEQTIRDAVQTSSELPHNTLLQKEKEKNKELAEYLRKSTVAINELTQVSNQVNSQLETVKKFETSLTQHIKVLRGSPSLFELLYQQKKTLPVRNKNATKQADDLAKLRLNQFYLSQQRDAFDDPKNYVNQLILGNQADQEVEKNLLELAKKRDKLYSSLQSNLSQLVNLSVNLQINQKQLEEKTKDVTHIIDEQMFWTPSNPPISLNWFKQKTFEFKEDLKGTVISYHKVTDMLNALMERPWIFIPLALLIMALIVKRKKIRNAIHTINATIGNVRTDTQGNTPLVLLLDILLALPITLTFALAGIALIAQGQETNIIYGKALLELALGWLVFNVIYLALGKDNIAVQHFGFAADKAKMLRKHVTLLGILILVMMLIMSLSNGRLENITQSGFYIVFILLCYPLLSLLLTKILLTYKAHRNFQLLNWLFTAALILTPIVLMVATMAGYYFTATKIMIRLINTFYLVSIWALLDGMVMRWLRVEARRLAYQRAIEKRQVQIQLREQEQTSEDLPIIIEEPKLDVETINQQSLKVMRLFLFGIMAFVFYFIWADVLVVFSHLNTITLYHYVDAENKLVALSLMGFVVAVIVFVVMILLVRNLPGLLEILILSRLRLSKGVSYAITTLLSYIIVGVGIFISLGILGVSWNKLQWLVAALSVGLGFGLQEIFANFISGIIMLFERPVRIGDRITIGSVTGTVRRINIRATHIKDTEGKDVIIPNKKFVTGELTNWTLTSTSTRVLLKIGIAYDSNVDQVKQLLLQIANNNPRVVKDPAPSVNLTNFGADALEVHLSMYVYEIADRSAATDEINREILKVFTQENIEMPYQQIDITLKNSPAQELHPA